MPPEMDIVLKTVSQMTCNRSKMHGIIEQLRLATHDFEVFHISNFEILIFTLLKNFSESLALLIIILTEITN